MHMAATYVHRMKSSMTSGLRVTVPGGAACFRCALLLGRSCRLGVHVQTVQLGAQHPYISTPLHSTRCHAKPMQQLHALAFADVRACRLRMAASRSSLMSSSSPSLHVHVMHEQVHPWWRSSIRVHLLAVGVHPGPRRDGAARAAHAPAGQGPGARSSPDDLHFLILKVVVRLVKQRVPRRCTCSAAISRRRRCCWRVGAAAERGAASRHDSA